VRVNLTVALHHSGADLHPLGPFHLYIIKGVILKIIMCISKVVVYWVWGYMV
jgi:hypothetical protein